MQNQGVMKMCPNHNSSQLPTLTPEISPWMREVTKQRSLLRELFEQYGSPINLHYLKPFADNYEVYTSVLQDHRLKHHIFFARKANKCLAFAKEAHNLGFGVDTASYRELKQCLEAGCTPENLVITAAMKNERLVRLALSHDVLIILDNEDECRLTDRIAREINKMPRVGIRVSGFTIEGKKLYSRFGFDIDDVLTFISSKIGPNSTFDTLRFEGFHFHLNGYSRNERGEALLQTIQMANTLKKQNISTSFIDIGGGLLTNYLKNKTEWNTFWKELKKALRGQRPPITFGNNGLGYTMNNGTIQGNPDVYPYYNNTSKERFLSEILSYENDNGQSAASLMRELNIEFRMEPGRSLLDQTGMTLAKVVHRKKDQHGTWLVGLEMNRSQLSSSSADLLLDPEFVSMSTSTEEKSPTPVYFTGGYCLEQDIILKRKIMLPQLPEIGDVICFPNTAGYMMHFYETQSHLYDFSTNLIARDYSSSDFIRDKDW